MFTDFDWSDIFLGHYLISVFTCMIAVITTFVISRRKFLKTVRSNSLSKYSVKDSKDLSADACPDTTLVTKKSPALAAEKVIKENMTSEQQLQEHEIRKKQLAQIHDLMLKQRDKFGAISFSDIEEQMKLYQ